MKDRIMTHASLCTGIGACELAATWMGWENLFSCEIDEFCNKVLKYHYPKATHYGNIFEQDFREWRGQVDVLTAGFPCQVYSLAGKRLGDKDDRYLWPQVLRVIEEVRPTWFVGENVAGILSMVLTGEEVKVGSYTDVCGESYTMHETRQVYAVEQIKRDLESIGYSVQPVVIPACAVGAPHRRDRVWFIATNTDGAGLPETRSEQRAAGIAGDGLQRDVANPNGDRFGIRENKQKYITECQGETNDRSCRKDGITSNPSKSGFQERVNNGKQEDAKETRTGMEGGLERHGNERVTPDTNCVELQGGGEERDDYSQGEESRNERSPKLFFQGWQNFPTQSPVCSRDDGDTLGLSGITFSRWRQESIKALGNSMVAPLVYEIFLAIEQVEQIK